MKPDAMKYHQEKEYINSGRWKCVKSPHGAHHWIVQQNEMVCRYCQEIKPVTMAYFK